MSEHNILVKQETISLFIPKSKTLEFRKIIMGQQKINVCNDVLKSQCQDGRISQCVWDLRWGGQIIVLIVSIITINVIKIPGVPFGHSKLQPLKYYTLLTISASEYICAIPRLDKRQMKEDFLYNMYF